MISVGDIAPDFEATTDTGASVRLSDFFGKKVILFFYPFNYLPACYAEACSFRDAAPSVSARNTVILGVSGNSARAQAQWKSRLNLPYTLLSDPTGMIRDMYGVRGRFRIGRIEFLGKARSTIVIDEEGRVMAAYYGVFGRQGDKYIRQIMQHLA